MPHLYVQPTMFPGIGTPPLMAEITLCLVDDVWSIGARVVSLSTLEPVAISAGPGLSGLDAPEAAQEWLAEVVGVLQELHGGEPFQPGPATA